MPTAITDARTRHRLLRALGLLLLAVVLACVAACQPPRQPHRQVFEEAEQAYRSGQYDLALERYEAFLKAAPDHQLAPLAQQRVLSIERELEVVMGRREGPRPIYLRPANRDDLGAVHVPANTP